ncbi:hypothetical protein E2C01_026843 [Portunus trituberculatus]|uniref:Uncharacterized protein n=1 Tax=Portunus trituberculatus TaxID=210409 RepID=A0A5B7EGK8_PORTR|nr:hypothetical protein [Portunus trituberculatus]
MDDGAGCKLTTWQRHESNNHISQKEIIVEGTFCMSLMMLNPSRGTDWTLKASFVEAVGWAGRYHLANCSYKLVDATNSDSSKILLSRLLSNLADTRHPYQEE